MHRGQRAIWGVGAVLLFLLGLNFGVGAAGREVPLIEAVKRGDIAAVRTLVRQPGSVKTPEVDGTTALHWAVQRNNLPLVDLLLKAGADVKAANRYGVTPLMPACVNGNAAILEHLIQAGADANQAFASGETPLMTVALTGKADAIKVLLAHGADVNARESRRGQTALMWAASANNAEAVKLLVEVGADIHAKARGPEQDEHAAGAGSVPLYRQAGRVDAATPLMFAVRRGNIDAARVLVDAGAGVNEKLSDGTPALTVAIANAQWEMAAFLLDKGADPNDATPGWAPLHQLARTRQGLSHNRYPWPVSKGTVSALDLAKKLIARGANVNAQMTKKINDDVRNAYGPGVTVVGMAAKGIDLPLIQLLVASGADPFKANALGTTPLAAATGIEMFTPGEDSGEGEDTFAVVKYLVELGADVNAVNKRGETPLMGAVVTGYNPMVEYLVDKGANLEARDNNWWTPLLICEFGKPFGGAQVKNLDTAKLIRKLMTERGLSTALPDDNELYARLLGPCGHGRDLNPAPAGGTLRDRCDLP